MLKFSVILSDDTKTDLGSALRLQDLCPDQIKRPQEAKEAEKWRYEANNVRYGTNEGTIFIKKSIGNTNRLALIGYIEGTTDRSSIKSFLEITKEPLEGADIMLDRAKYFIFGDGRLEFFHSLPHLYAATKNASREYPLADQISSPTESLQFILRFIELSSLEMWIFEEEKDIKKLSNVIQRAFEENVFSSLKEKLDVYAEEYGDDINVTPIRHHAMMVELFSKILLTSEDIKNQPEEVQMLIELLESYLPGNKSLAPFTSAIESLKKFITNDDNQPAINFIHFINTLIDHKGIKLSSDFRQMCDFLRSGCFIDDVEYDFVESKLFEFVPIQDFVWETKDDAKTKAKEKILDKQMSVQNFNG